MADIISTFLAQLRTIEKMVGGYNNEQVRDTEVSFDELLMPFVHRKFIEYNMDQGIEEDDGFSEDDKEFLIKVTDKAMSQSYIYKKIYDNLFVKTDEDDKLEVECNASGLIAYISDQMQKENYDNLFGDRELVLRSCVIYMCISLESLVSDMLKEFYINYDSKDKFNDKKISFNDLKKINNIEEARIYLIENELENIFRNNFDKWFGEVNNTFGVSKTFPQVGEFVSPVSELFQRRNLYVHSNGIINNHYLRNTGIQLQKGDTIRTDVEYIKSKIKAIENIGWLIYYKYQCIKNNGINDEMFYELNNKLLDNLKTKTNAIPIIFNEFSENTHLKQTEQLYAKMNRFLFYKVNNQLDEVRDELEKFDVSIYSTQFVMAKSIILDNEDALSHTKKFIEEQDENNFFACLGWPLFELIKEKDGYKELFRDKLDMYLNNEEE